MPKKQTKKGGTPLLPFVSICTPTFNRRPFIQTMFECFKNQDYPKERMEWIIVDDGTDKIKDLIETSNIPQIRYFEIEKKLALGAKRNYMHKHVKGSIIVYMDDDDYYPPERVSHAVEMLQKNEKVLCAGASEIYLYFKTMGKMIQAGPYGPNHATAGTFAFKAELLKDTKYNDNAALAEERAFLKDYTVPFVQLDPLKTILVFSHEHNTFDKREMFQTAHPDYFKESPKTVDMFIRRPHEQSVKDFFMRDIDALLEKYEPGLPKMKPDVLVQIEQIKKERDEMIKRETEKMQNGPILLQQGEGKPPIQLTSAQVVNIIQQLQETNAKLVQQNADLQNAFNQLQRIVQTMGNVPNEHNKTPMPATQVPNKLIPDKI
jgi:glycosyltransferase involved in cell wall biosynthesis